MWANDKCSSFAFYRLNCQRAAVGFGDNLVCDRLRLPKSVEMAGLDHVAATDP